MAVEDVFMKVPLITLASYDHALDEVKVTRGDTLAKHATMTGLVYPGQDSEVWHRQTEHTTRPENASPLTEHRDSLRLVEVLKDSARVDQVRNVVVERQTTYVADVVYVRVLRNIDVHPAREVNMPLTTTKMKLHAISA